MRLDTGAVWQAVQDTLQNPRMAARALIALCLPVTTGAMALALMIVVTAALSTLAYYVFPTEMPQEWANMFENPLKLAGTQGLIMLVTLMLILGVGRLFGGNGGLAEAVVLLAWVEFVLLILQVAQVLLLLVVPPLASAVGLLGGFLFIWLTTQFVAELHGFRSAGLVFLSMVATVLTISFGMALVMVVFWGARG